METTNATKCPRCSGSGQFGRHGTCHLCHGTGTYSRTAAKAERDARTIAAEARTAREAAIAAAAVAAGARPSDGPSIAFDALAGVARRASRRHPAAYAAAVAEANR